MTRAPSSIQLKPGGLGIAIVGFLLTRFVVATSIRVDISLAPFVFGEIPFLLIGLGLATYGVVLTVGVRDRTHVRTVLTWCLLGVGGVGLVIGSTALGSAFAPPTEPVPVSFFPRVLLGGAVAGTLTGIYAARTRRQQRSSSEQADRLTVLNRLLRHEVLNKLTAIRGYAELDHPGSDERIRHNVDRIDDIIQQVGALASTSADPVVLDLDEVGKRALTAARERHPQATFELRSADHHADAEGEIPAYTTPRLETVLYHLLDNAVEHAGTASPTVAIEVGGDGTSAWLSVVDDGPGLPPEQQALLRERKLPRYDDPTAGFGLAIARLLLDECDAVVDVDTGGGTTIAMRFARAIGATDGLPTRRLLTAVGASIVAGVVMGLTLSTFAGVIPVIGALYGATDAAVGWLTHLFHSVVFGLGFAAVVSHPRVRARLDGTPALVASGAGYGVFLTLVAAGVVMPLWLRLVGIPAPIPSGSLVSLAGHLLWGGVLAGLFAVFRDIPEGKSL